MKKKTENTKDKMDSSLRRISNRIIINRVLILMFTAILFFTVIKKMETERLDVKIGDIAPVEIRATKDIVDEYATNALKEEVKNKVEPRYRVSPSIQMTMKDIMNQFFNKVEELKENKDLSLQEKTEVLINESRVPITKKEGLTALNMNETELTHFRTIIFDLINQIMNAGITEEDLDYEKDNIEKIFQSLDIKDASKELGISLINNTIQPNKFIDEEATKSKIDEELSKVEPVIVKEHQIIVRKGDIIDSRTYELIKESGLLKEDTGYDYNNISGILILVLLMQTFLFGYIYIFHKDVLFDNRLSILVIIVIAMILISKGLFNISPYIMPITAVTLLIAILIDIRLSIIVNFYLVFIFSLILDLDDIIMAMYAVSGTISAYLTTRQLQRNNIFINGAIIGLINVLIIVSFGLLKKMELVELLVRSGYGFANGILCAILTIGSLPMWENLFQVLTPLKLLELSNPNQPLLKKLLLEAPGTYHHSIIVGNLSERAAEVVGADPLIARVGAYYHDIGKLSRPYYFKENQLGGDNPHDRLEPGLSASIIINHAKDGLELGKKYKLPKRVLDIIVQHHGDTLVQYFYHKAKQENGEEVNMKNFRYEGPKPQTKEAAIVMLADSTEAAVRSIKEPNKENIEAMIKNIIKGKLNDNQLDECDLTLRNLKEISEAFLSVMMGIFHERIEYPEIETAKGDA